MENYTERNSTNGRAQGVFYQDENGDLHFSGTIYSSVRTLDTRGNVVGSVTRPVIQNEDILFAPGKKTIDQAGNITYTYE